MDWTFILKKLTDLSVEEEETLIRYIFVYELLPREIWR